MLYSCIRLKAGLTSIMQVRICYKQISSHIIYTEKKLQIFTYAINECAGQNHSIFHGFGQQNELRHLHMVLIDQNIYQAWQNL